MCLRLSANFQRESRSAWLFAQPDILLLDVDGYPVSQVLVRGRYFQQAAEPHTITNMLQWWGITILLEHETRVRPIAGELAGEHD